MTKKKLTLAQAKWLKARNTPAARIHRALKILYTISAFRDLGPRKQKLLPVAIRALEKIVSK